MKNTPILFSGPMVRAILAGTKTQTRRVMTAPAWLNPAEIPDMILALNRFGCAVDHIGPADGRRRIACPFGVAGDHLWVRETFGLARPSFPDESDDARVVYRATDAAPTAKYFCWRPSINMPFWACRLHLHIKSVRVERLNDISEEDARAEGVAGVAEFRELWESLNGAGSWSINPFVWTVTFEVIE